MGGKAWGQVWGVCGAGGGGGKCVAGIELAIGADIDVRASGSGLPAPTVAAAAGDDAGLGGEAPSAGAAERTMAASPIEIGRVCRIFAPFIV